MNTRTVFLLWIFLRVAKTSDVENSIESCLLKILKMYFLHEPILLITDLTVDKEPFKRRLMPNLEKEYHRQMIGKIMTKRGWTVQIYNTDKFVGLPAKLKLNKLKNCFFFIRPEVVNSEKLFLWEMDRLRKNPLWTASARNVIVVKGKENEEGEKLARKIIENLWTKSKAVNNLVMVALGDGDIIFYTWFPYRQPDCGRVKSLVSLDIYQNGKFVWKGDLFPQKIEYDLENCEILAATEECIPYVFADPYNASKFVSGVEVNIVNQLSTMLNFKLVTTRPKNMWMTSINKTLTGAFKLLVDQEIDIAFSCLMLNRERFLVAKALPSYYEDSLVWFVPSPRHKSHALDVFYAFPFKFWLIMTSVLIASGILIVLLARGEHGWRKFTPNLALAYIFKLFGMSVYAPIEIRSRRYSMRVFIIIFCVYSMHVTVSFQSSLFLLYRKPHHNFFFTSLAQAVDAGLLVYLRSSAQELYNQSDHALWNKILQPEHHDYLTDFGEVFSRIAYDKDAVALYIRTTGIYMISLYFTDEYGKPEILWLRRKFAPYPLAIYMSPEHPLYRAFETRLYWLLSTGLVRIWLRRSVTARRLSWYRDYDDHVLSLKHLGGSFFLLLSFLTVSLLVFIGELLVFRCFNKKKIKKPQHRCLYPPNKSKFAKSNSVAVIKVGKHDIIYVP